MRGSTCSYGSARRWRRRRRGCARPRTGWPRSYRPCEPTAPGRGGCAGWSRSPDARSAATCAGADPARLPAERWRAPRPSRRSGAVVAFALAQHPPDLLASDHGLTPPQARRPLVQRERPRLEKPAQDDLLGAKARVELPQPLRPLADLLLLFAQAISLRLRALGELVIHTPGAHEVARALDDLGDPVRLEALDQGIAVERVQELGHRVRPRGVGVPDGTKSEERRHGRQAQAIPALHEVLECRDGPVSGAPLPLRRPDVREPAVLRDAGLSRGQIDLVGQRLAVLLGNALRRVIGVAAGMRPRDVVEHQEWNLH